MFGVGPPLLVMGAVAVTFVTMPPPRRGFRFKKRDEPAIKIGLGDDAWC